MVLDLVQRLRRNPVQTPVREARICVHHAPISKRNRDSIPCAGEQVGGNNQLVRHDGWFVVSVQAKLDSRRSEETLAHRIHLVERNDEPVSEVEQNVAYMSRVLDGRPHPRRRPHTSWYRNRSGSMNTRSGVVWPKGGTPPLGYEPGQRRSASMKVSASTSACLRMPPNVPRLIPR